MAGSEEKIEVFNVNTPGKTTRVDRAKDEDMRAALVQTLPKGAPGLSAQDARSALLHLLDPALFPDGATSGWWFKTVQLDLEAKKIVARTDQKPLTFYLV